MMQYKIEYLETEEQLLSIDKDMFWYLASPYSKYAYGLETAFGDVAEVASDLMLSGIRKLFCPITHSHPIAEAGPLDNFAYEIWTPLNDAVIPHCDGMIIAQLPGWQESKGIAIEVDQFIASKKRVVAITPKDILKLRRSQH